MESSEVAITQFTIIARRLLEQFKGEIGEHRAYDSVDNQRLLDFILNAFYDVGRIAVALRLFTRVSGWQRWITSAQFFFQYGQRLEKALK